MQRAPVAAARDLTLGGARVRERLLSADMNEREHLGIERLDAVEMLLDHIDGRDRSRADQPRELCRIESAETGVAHSRASSVRSSRPELGPTTMLLASKQGAGSARRR